MKTRTILALVASMILLSILYYIDYRMTLNIEKENFRRTHILPPDAAGDIRFFDIESPRGRVRIEKAPDGMWWITQPIEVAADQKTIRANLIEPVAEAVRYARFPLTTDQKEAFGFEDDALAVSIGMDNGETIDFAIGRDAPIPGEVYLTMGAEPGVAYVTGASLREAFNKDLLQLRDKTVLRMAFEDLGAMDVTVKPKDGALKPVPIRLNDGEWTVTGPDGEDYDADANVLREVIGALKIMEAVPFDKTAQTLSPATGEYPEILLDFQARGSDEATSLLLQTAIDKDGQPVVDETTNRIVYFATRSDSDLVFEVEPPLVEVLANPFRTFRDRHLVRMDPKDVHWLQIEWFTGNNVPILFALERTDEGNWRMTSQPEQDIHQVRVLEYITIASRLRVANFSPTPPPPNVAAAGLEQPTVRITLANADRSDRQGIEVGTGVLSARDQRYGRQLLGAGDQVVEPGPIVALELPDAFIDALRRPPEFFMRTPLLDFNPAETGRVEVHIRAENTTNTITVEQRTRANATGWFGSINQQEPRNLPVNVTDAFISALYNMEYLVKLDQAVSEAALKTAGLDDPIYRIRVFDKQGRETSGFAFGLIGQDQALIMVRDQKGDYFYVKREAFAGFEATFARIVSRLE